MTSYRKQNIKPFNYPIVQWIGLKGENLNTGNPSMFPFYNWVCLKIGDTHIHSNFHGEHGDNPLEYEIFPIFRQTQLDVGQNGRPRGPQMLV